MLSTMTPWQAFAAATTAALAMYGAVRSAEQPLRTTLLIAATATAALIGAYGGAQLLNALGHFAGAGDTAAAMRHRWSLDGALCGGACVGYALARLFGVDPFRAADLATPATAAGIAIARWGCFQQGCCYGRPTSLPWSVSPGWGTPAAREALSRAPLAVFGGTPSVHPTQLYELFVAAFIALSSFLVLTRRRTPPGFIATGAWASFSGWRLVNDALRSPATLTLPATLFIHGMMLLTAIVLLAYVVRRHLASKPLAATQP
ncbi:MAG: prolipoprotein diacylglyceryl transferase [Planctomycetales bacterium]|nr:prolipoprotein diacylglyceryl transferase [Planctomycetales bacterium]MBN8625368.1 prolipoprotein diacylglyceryl transferase [Planctomycetota bacterium]